jgi:hypothetical protein
MRDLSQAVQSQGVLLRIWLWDKSKAKSAAATRLLASLLWAIDQPVSR